MLPTNLHMEQTMLYRNGYKNTGRREVKLIKQHRVYYTQQNAKLIDRYRFYISSLPEEYRFLFTCNSSCKVIDT